MRHLDAALGLVAISLGLSLEPVAAQTDVVSRRDERPLHAPDVLTRGLTLTEAQCGALPTAVWVRAEGQTYCIRYWISVNGGQEENALIFVPGDIGSNHASSGALNSYTSRVTSAALQRDADKWSRRDAGPYIYLARPGTFGSSGRQRDSRRTFAEVNAMTAALDLLKARYGFKRFHAVGQSGGAHTVVAMAQMRNDIGCAVSASGGLSVKSEARRLARGDPLSSRVLAAYDPVDQIGAMRSYPGLRLRYAAGICRPHEGRGAAGLGDHRGGYGPGFPRAGHPWP